jgi:PLP dependent protein
VATRLAAVQQRVADACAQADRSPASVTIIGVTKTHPPALCRAAVAAGLVDLAENRVQELVAKQPHVPGARWHLVGRLQRNKVRAVVGQQVLVHSLDRRRLADALSRRARTWDRCSACWSRSTSATIRPRVGATSTRRWT